MKILFFYPVYYKYGVSNALKKICTYLISCGYVVYVATEDYASGEFSFISSDNFHVLRRRSSESKISFARRALSLECDAFIGVQGHNAYWLVFANILFFFRNKKIVSWEHTSPMVSMRIEKKSFWPIHFIVKFFISFFIDCFFCVSRGICCQIHNLFFVSHKKIKFVPNIIFSKSDVFHPGGCDTLPAEKTIFLTVGRLSVEKGVDLALNALELIGRDDWEYWLVGDGPLRQSLMDKCEGSQVLSRRVKFFGWSDTPGFFFHQADVLLLPSYYEGLPTVLVEASLYGVPLISADCPTGPNEVIIDGKNGYLFKVGDHVDLAEKIKCYFLNKNSLKNSREYVMDFEYFNAGNMFIKALN